MKGSSAQSVLEEYMAATQELAGAVASEDWRAALLALERRESLIPELGRLLGETQSASLAAQELGKSLNMDENSRAGLLEARSRTLGQLRETQRMALWVRSAQLADGRPGARLADIQG